jgi:hypothetical protein
VQRCFDVYRQLIKCAWEPRYLYCPQCLTEYREGFTQCADCQVPLQSALPVKPESQPLPEMVGVLDTNDNFALCMATTALVEAGIDYDVVDIRLPENLRNTNPKWWISPCRVLVAREDETEARALVEPFQEPLVIEADPPDPL